MGWDGVWFSAEACFLRDHWGLVGSEAESLRATGRGATQWGSDRVLGSGWWCVSLMTWFPVGIGLWGRVGVSMFGVISLYIYIVFSLP